MNPRSDQCHHGTRISHGTRSKLYDVSSDPERTGKELKLKKGKKRKYEIVRKSKLWPFIFFAPQVSTLLEGWILVVYDTAQRVKNKRKKSCLCLLRRREQTTGILVTPEREDMGGCWFITKYHSESFAGFRASLVSSRP